MNDAILETPRLILRKMTQDDFAELCKILQDEAVMYAYEHAFSDTEVQSWLDNQIKRYSERGFGLLAVVLKSDGQMIGQCGLTMQNITSCDSIHEKNVIEIGYLLQKSYWHNGYATEAARGCKAYAFEELNVGEVYSTVRDTNFASQNVAIRNGMTKVGEFVKHYYNLHMPHYIYMVKNNLQSK